MKLFDLSRRARYRPTSRSITPIIGIVALLTLFQAAAEPFIPSDDAEVLETLRTQPGDPSVKEARRLRAELARDPSNMEAAIAIAQKYIREARSEADPRFFGYAQAALAPWWNIADAPPEIQYMRATLLQASHNFKDALIDLERILKEDPRYLNAWLERAVIYQVKGDFAEARKSCEPLLRAAERNFSLRLLATSCAASVAGFNGEAQASHDKLREVLASTINPSPEDEQWALIIMADTAARTGQPAVAEPLYKKAMSLSRNSWLIGAYADFLLDQGRPQDVIELLKDEERADTLLLLLTLAEKQLGAPMLAEHTKILSERFEAMRTRNDMRHLREEARFTLHILGKPEQALTLAEANWATQHEPEDARILLAAALAANNPEAAQPVLDFLEQSRLEDIHLTELSHKIRELPS